MADPTLLFGVGATKAGTSWLYNALQNHPDCYVRAQKEVHYWDSFAPQVQADQIKMLKKRLAEFAAIRAEAETVRRGWQVANMDRRIAAVEGLIQAIGGDRTYDAAYRAWLVDGIEGQRVVADITPSYAILPEDVLHRMVMFGPATKFIYLIRDPLARLWSHIRMQAQRQRQEDQEFELKSNRILWRILNKGQEPHLTDRGDYVAAITRLRKVVPEGHLKIVFAEDMFTPQGLADICAFLGIAYHPAPAEEKVHEGKRAQMRADLVPKAIAYLRDQYEWVARHVGPLPQAWQDNLAKATA